MSQRELGRRAEISQGAVSAIELDKRVPGSELLAKLAFALGVTPNELLQDAGLVREPSDVARLVDVLRQLEPDERQRVDEYARWRLKEQKGRYRTG